MSHDPTLHFPQRTRLPHEAPPWVNPAAIFFITIGCSKRGVNQLCTAIVRDIVFETVNFRQARNDWHVHLLLLMPDHLHVLISFPPDRSMRRTVANWKEIVAKRSEVRWQRDFFDHRLRNDASYVEKASYIRNNPVRKGLVARAADWEYVWEPARE